MPVRRPAAAALAAVSTALWFAPAWALAQSTDADAAVAPDAAPAGDDVLTLRDGTTLRGRVTEVQLGDHATIALASGEARTVPWRAIASADGPAFEHGLPASPPPPAPAPVDNTPARADFTREAWGRVPLRVESDGPEPQRVGVTLSLEAQGTGFESRLQMNHRVFCTTPCTLFVPPGPFALYSTGRGIVETTTQLDVPRVGLTARVFAPSVQADRFAIAFLSIGTVAALVGAITLAASFSAAGPLDAVEYTGLGLIGVGVVLLPIGLALLATNHRGVHALRRGVAGR